MLELKKVAKTFSPETYLSVLNEFYFVFKLTNCAVDVSYNCNKHMTSHFSDLKHKVDCCVGGLMLFMHQLLLHELTIE